MLNCFCFCEILIGQCCWPGVGEETRDPGQEPEEADGGGDQAQVGRIADLTSSTVKTKTKTKTKTDGGGDQAQVGGCCLVAQLDLSPPRQQNNIADQCAKRKLTPMDFWLSLTSSLICIQTSRNSLTINEKVNVTTALHHWQLSILIGLQAINEETTGHGPGETGGAGEVAQGRSQNDLSNRYKKLKEELENQK